MLRVKLSLSSVFFVTLFFMLSNCSENSINEKADVFLSEVEESELKEAINSLGKSIIGKKSE